MTTALYCDGCGKKENLNCPNTEIISSSIDIEKYIGETKEKQVLGAHDLCKLCSSKLTEALLFYKNNGKDNSIIEVISRIYLTRWDCMLMVGSAYRNNAA